MPTLHEIRALSSHLYAKAGYQVTAVQELMAHTDPDMTRAYQKGHARKVLRVAFNPGLDKRQPQPGPWVLCPSIQTHKSFCCQPHWLVKAVN